LLYILLWKINDWIELNWIISWSASFCHPILHLLSAYQPICTTIARSCNLTRSDSQHKSLIYAVKYISHFFTLVITLTSLTPTRLHLLIKKYSTSFQQSPNSYVICYPLIFRQHVLATIRQLQSTQVTIITPPRFEFLLP